MTLRLLTLDPMIRLLHAVAENSDEPIPRCGYFLKRAYADGLLTQVEDENGHTRPVLTEQGRKELGQ